MMFSPAPIAARNIPEHLPLTAITQNDATRRFSSGEDQEVYIVLLTESQQTADGIKSRAEGEGALERAFEKQGLVITHLTINMNSGAGMAFPWLPFGVLGALLLPMIFVVWATVKRRSCRKRTVVTSSGSSGQLHLTSELVFPLGTHVSQAPPPIVFAQGQAASAPSPAFGHDSPAFSQGCSLAQDKPLEMVRHAPALLED